MKIDWCVVKKSIEGNNTRQFSVNFGLGRVMRLLWLAPFFLLSTGSVFLTAQPLTAQPLTAQSFIIAQPLTFELIKNESINVTGEIVGRYFFVEFETLAYINPKASGYFIVAYANQQIPYDGQNKPIASESVPCTTSDCSHALEAPITDVPYIIGIGSNHSIDTIATTLNFMPGDPKGIPFNPAVSVLQIGVNSVIVSYDMPLGYNPKNSKSWVGIWGEGGSSTELLGKAEINSVQSSGSQAINGLMIEVNSVYNIGLFSGPDDEDIVGQVTIKVKPD